MKVNDRLVSWIVQLLSLLYQEAAIFQKYQHLCLSSLVRLNFYEEKPLKIHLIFFEAFGLITPHGFMSAVSTAVGLMTVMNEHIVATAPVGPPGGPQFPPTQDPTFPWPLLISVVKEVEVLVEMGSEYYLGKEHKWTPVATVEAIK